MIIYFVLFLQMQLQPWNRCFYKYLFIAAFFPFLLFYFNFTIPYAFYSTVAGNRHLRRFTHHTSITANNSQQDTPKDSEHESNHTDNNRYLKSEYTYDQQFYDDLYDDYYFNSEKGETVQLMVNLTKPLKGNGQTKSKTKPRKQGHGHVKTKSTAVGDIWQYVNDTKIKYNSTRYSTAEKTKLMKKYYPVVSININRNIN